MDILSLKTPNFVIDPCTTTEYTLSSFCSKKGVRIMESRAFEFDFRVEEITRAQAGAILESIRAHVTELGVVMGGGFVEAQDEPEVENEHSNIYTPPPSQEEIEEMLAHRYDCNCPGCSGEIPAELEAQEMEALVDMGLTNEYLVQFDTEDEEGFTTTHIYFVCANTSEEALERTLIYMAENDITSAAGTPVIEITEVLSIPVF
jgi:hypothetical protein